MSAPIAATLAAEAAEEKELADNLAKERDAGLPPHYEVSLQRAREAKFVGTRFSNVLCTETFYSMYTRPLTFEGFWAGAFADLRPHQSQYVGGSDNTWRQACTSYSFHEQIPPFQIL